MQQYFTETGGVSLGWFFRASWPFAKLSATSECLTIKIGLVGTFAFTPDQVLAIEPHVKIPFFARGIRIRHCASEYPQRIIFWSLGNSNNILQSIRDAGFQPSAPSTRAYVWPGMPLRWSAIIGLAVGWVVLSFLPDASASAVPEWADCILLILAFALTAGTLKSMLLQRLLLKPGRNFGEIRYFVRFLAFISGLLAVIFSVLTLTGSLNH